MSQPTYTMLNTDFASTEYPYMSAKWTGAPDVSGSRSYAPRDDDEIQVDWSWNLSAAD